MNSDLVLDDLQTFGGRRRVWGGGGGGGRGVLSSALEFTASAFACPMAVYMYTYCSSVTVG